MITVSQALAAASVVGEDIDPDSRESLIDGALPIAGLFVLVLLIAMFFLWRSMSKQMKKIDPSLPDGPDDREQARDRALTREAVERGESADPDDVAR
jgi:hypothetical protein